MTFIVISTNTNPAQTRTIDWTRFKVKFELVIYREISPCDCKCAKILVFQPSSCLSCLEICCQKVRTLSLHQVNIQPKDIMKLSSDDSSGGSGGQCSIYDMRREGCVVVRQKMEPPPSPTLWWPISALGTGITKNQKRISDEPIRLQVPPLGSMAHFMPSKKKLTLNPN